MLQREAALKEAKKPKVSTTGPVKKKQLTLEESVALVTHYDHSSHRYQLITHKLAIFLGCTNFANSLVENEEFLSLIQTLDPRYKVSGRTSVSKEIDKVMFDMKGCTQKVLADARKVSLCTDIWTKKGLTSSYLGLTAHFFSRYNHRRHRITLAVRQIMQHPHNAETIREMVEEILKEWGIPLDKILAILTDNFVSNVLMATTKRMRFQPKMRLSVSMKRNRTLSLEK